MIARDKDALVCDLAEVYGIYDMKALPVSLLATLSCGLRENSRIKLKLSGMPQTQNTILLASAVDSLAFIAWSKTKDAQSGRNKPKSIVQLLLGQEQNGENLTFASADEFEITCKKIREGVKNGGE